MRHARHGLSLAQCAEAARLTVSDTCCGIDKNALPHVFDHLRQVTPGERAGGLGLGLAIVRELVELQGGKVSAASNGRDQRILYS